MDFLTRLVIILSLITTSGVAAIAILRVWEKVFELALQMFNMKKEFIDFVYHKYHENRVIRPKMYQSKKGD